MNKARRKQADAINSKLADLKGELESLLEREQEVFDNMPDNLKDSSKGEQAQADISSLEDANSGVEQAIEALTNIIENGV